LYRLLEYCQTHQEQKIFESVIVTEKRQVAESQQFKPLDLQIYRHGASRKTHLSSQNAYIYTPQNNNL
jgi:hypothetical protein